MQSFDALATSSRHLGITILRRFNDAERSVANSLETFNDEDRTAALDHAGTLAIEMALIRRLLSGALGSEVLVTDDDYYGGIEKLGFCTPPIHYPHVREHRDLADVIPFRGDYGKVMLNWPDASAVEVAEPAGARQAVAALTSAYHEAGDVGRYATLAEDPGIRVQGALWMTRARIITYENPALDTTELAAALDLYRNPPPMINLRR
jgi:hypothetical protein